MTDLQITDVGAVSSADIAVPDHARMQRFYSSVLTTGERPLWREDLTNRHGTPVIGLGAGSPEHADLPLQWMPHIQVADVAASTRRALELGGKELMHGKDEAGESRWSVLLDPNGAAFGLIPRVPVDAIGATHDDVPVAGRIAWLDLTVPDAPATRDFYTGVVGWAVGEVAMKDGTGPYADYVLLTPGGRAVSGICHARGMNQSLPPVWLIYLPVGDLPESLERVVRQGGEILQARHGPGSDHPFAVIRDPVGAYLALVPA